MHTNSMKRLLICPRILAGIVLSALFLSMLPEQAHAVSSWNPTLLVNTESFEAIDSGDGTTDVELRFGATTQTLKFLTTNKFQFSHSLSVIGSISGSSLTIDGVSSFSGAVTAKRSLTVKGALSGASIRISGPAEVHGALSASGAIRTDGDLTINDDQTAADAVLTFGQPTTNQTLKYLNTSGKFQFSKGLSVVGGLSGSWLNVDGVSNLSGALTVKGGIKGKGNISGATLTVDGDITLHGVTYSAPSAQGAANTFLKNDGAGALTWSAVTVGNGSGGILSLHPEYPNAIYFSSGSTYIGQLAMSGGTTDLENTYKWTTSRSSLQDYWVSIRGRVPDNFSTWDPVKPAEFRFKTGVAGSANNHLTLRIRDTAGTMYGLTGGLVGTSFTTASNMSLTAFASGTWTPKSYFTVYVKLAATSAANAAAHAGWLNLNYETTTP